MNLTFKNQSTNLERIILNNITLSYLQKDRSNCKLSVLSPASCFFNITNHKNCEALENTIEKNLFPRNTVNITLISFHQVINVLKSKIDIIGFTIIKIGYANKFQFGLRLRTSKLPYNPKVLNKDDIYKIIKTYNYSDDHSDPALKDFMKNNSNDNWEIDTKLTMNELVEKIRNYKYAKSAVNFLKKQANGT